MEKENNIKVAKGLIVTTSWDDGTTTDLKLARLLNKYGIAGTFYICRKSSMPNLLQEEEIVAIGKDYEIGAHTMNHSDLTKISLSQAEYEIGASKKYLENLLGKPISMFSYPYGKYNNALKQIVKSCGFIGARACNPRGFKLASDPYQFPITLFASNDSPLMALKICMKAHLWKFNLLLDWESRVKALFDLALRMGGVYHIYGHSADFDRNNEWGKLEDVLNYITNRKEVQYMTNGEVAKNEYSF